LVLTAIFVVAVLFARRAYYFFYDFHFLFPRAAARWQTTLAALLLLSLPVVFRLGVAPALLAVFAATTLYLPLGERLVGAALIACLGLVPTLGGLAVEATALAETPAATLAKIERGGPGVEPVVRRLEALAAEDKVGFSELYVLGRHHLRRGQVERAIPFLQRALTMSPQDVGARINMGVAFFLSGDLENSRALLEVVAKDAQHPFALYNLGRVYQRRVAVYGELAASEVDKAMSALTQAAGLDPSLPRPNAEEHPLDLSLNQLLRSVPLSQPLVLAQATAGDGPERVRSQLTHLLLGEVPEPLGSLYPLALGALLVAFGALGPRIQVAKECNRCGKAVSPRGDPDVSPGSPMCTQCINVFAKKNVVAPSLKVRKQLEVARYHARRDRAGLILGAVCAGLGHVFSGWPLRGAVFAFMFLGAVVFAVLRQGVLRPPYDAVPGFIKLLPLLTVAGLVYLLSLRGLRRRQG
jgi:tetratricopeptide (TPR) repeat protein